MRRANLVGLLWIALAATTAVAAEPTVSAPNRKAEAAKKAAAEITEPVIPKRELKFEVSEEPYELALFAADPKLLERRYVAIVRLGADRAAFATDSDFPDDLRNLATDAIQSDGFARVVGRLAGLTGAQQRLPEDVLSALTTESENTIRCVRKDNRGRSRRASAKGDGTEAFPSTDYEFYFHIYAPTVDRAKELAAGLITLYDYGYCYPMQAATLKQRRLTVKERVPKARAALKEAQQALADYQKQLDAFQDVEDVREEALDQLTAQRRLILVELAGVEARIDACNKILAAGQNPRRTEQVETIKIAAEIELVGLAARRDTIKQIVDRVRQRLKLLEGMPPVSGKVISRERAVSSSERAVVRFEQRREESMPFAIVGGKIEIRPIRWTSKPKGRSVFSGERW